MLVTYSDFDRTHCGSRFLKGTAFIRPGPKGQALAFDLERVSMAGDSPSEIPGAVAMIRGRESAHKISARGVHHPVSAPRRHRDRGPGAVEGLIETVPKPVESQLLQARSREGVPNTAGKGPNGSAEPGEAGGGADLDRMDCARKLFPRRSHGTPCGNRSRPSRLDAASCGRPIMFQLS